MRNALPISTTTISALGAAMLALLLCCSLVPKPAAALPPHNVIPGPAICAELKIRFSQAIKQDNGALVHQLGQELNADNCYGVTSIPKPTPGKVCSAGIKNISVFLQACPTSDPAFATILQALPISFDGVSQSTAAVTQNVNAVCKSIQSPSAPAPTLKQQAQYTAMQVLRTAYYMDNQGTTGCPYPWTHGASVYVWMTSLLAGIDIHDNTAFSECCESGSGGKVLLSLMEPAANQYPTDYSWIGVANQLALYVHETRHAPGNVSPPNGPAYLHTTCCPEQTPGQPASCDQTYQEGSTLAPYGTQYWLFRAWLKGDVNVGYSCASQSDIMNISEFFQATADGYIGRFCTNAPPQVSMPSVPGGVCPP